MTQCKKIFTAQMRMILIMTYIGIDESWFSVAWLLIMTHSGQKVYTVQEKEFWHDIYCKKRVTAQIEKNFW